MWSVMRRFVFGLALAAGLVGFVRPAEAQFRLSTFKNNATSGLAVAIDDNDTAVTVDTGDGAKFPSPTGGEYFWLTLVEGSTIEVLKCTARTDDAISGCTRAQQTTAASAFTDAATVFHGPTAEDFNAIKTLTGLTFVVNAATTELSNEIVMGTGVSTALAANVGSAGAPVVFNGALGTPSSGTLTNATGLPVSSGISGLGTGVATALAVNTGSAGAPVLFNGALGTPSSGTATNITGLPTAGLTFAATNRILCRDTASGGAGEECTASAVLAMISATQGDVLYHNGTSWVALGAGTNGHYLQTQGAGANPQWAAGAGGGLASTDIDTSAELAAILGDETGDGGGFVRANNATMVAPALGVATATSVTVNTEAYDSTGWNADNTVPTKDAVRDILETFVAFTDPNADRPLFWDDSAGTVEPLTMPSTFSISSTTLAVTIPKSYYFRLAACQNTTASVGVDVFTSGGATATCVTGTNATRAVLDFANSGVVAVQGGFRLPPNYTGTISVNMKWRTSATSGDVVWQVATACTATAEVFNDTFNTASTVTDTAAGTTLQLNDAAIASLTATGCAAGEHFQWRLFRDADHASDSLAATAQMLDIEFRVPEVF